MVKYSLPHDIAQASLKDRVTTHLSIPSVLMREWHNRKNTYELKDMHISEAVTYTMHFGLFGPHPYMNPLEAIIDAFQFYEENRRFEKDMAKDVIKKLAKAYGMTVKIDD